MGDPYTCSVRKLFSLLLFAPYVCLAHVDRASLTGTLRDASGSLVPGAAVSAFFPATGLRREVLSSESGIYLISALPVGSCEVEVRRAGFQTVKTRSVTLSVGETRTLDVTLAVGA